MAKPVYIQSCGPGFDFPGMAVYFDIAKIDTLFVLHLMLWPSPFDYSFSIYKHDFSIFKCILWWLL